MNMKDKLARIFGRPSKATSATLAKERLQIVISNQRAKQTGLDFLPALQRDLLEVIKRYVDIDQDSVNVEWDHVGELLELNISLPEIAAERAEPELEASEAE